MEKKEIEQILKTSIWKEVKADGQSEKYFDNLWLFWWSAMDTNVQNGIINAFKENKNTA